MCVVRVQNDDGSYFDFSAIGVTNSSENLAQSRAGTDARAGAPRAAGGRGQGHRRVALRVRDRRRHRPEPRTAPLASVEFAPVDIFGNMAAWQENPHPLPAARSFAASAVVGRYIYVYGGSRRQRTRCRPARARWCCRRARAPVIDDIDLCLSGDDVECFGRPDRAGLAAGTYSYRVAAVIDEQRYA